MLLGGSGFIGGRLARRLQAQGDAPVIVDRVRPSQPDVEYHAAGLRTVGDLMPDVLESVQAVYLLAWTTKPQEADQSPAGDLESNVMATLHLLDCMTRLQRRPRLIFISTGGAAYGPAAPTPTPESACVDPIGAYAIGKLVCERYLALYHRQHGLDYLVARPGNPYGEGQDPQANQGAVAVFLGRLARNESITIWGDGGVIRDYLYIDDLVAGLAAMLDYQPADAAAPRIFNFGSGVGVSLTQLLQKIAAVTGVTPRVRHEPARAVDVPGVILDCTRAKQLLGWSVATELEVGLAQTWRRFAADGDKLKQQDD